MRERLRFLLERNAAKRDKEARFDSFARLLGSLATFDPSKSVYASFEETSSILDRIPEIAVEYPEGLEWSHSDLTDFRRLLQLMYEYLPDQECFVIFYDHFLFIGAMRIDLETCLQNIEAFLDLGEETLLIVDHTHQNFLELARDEDDFSESGYEYLVSIFGREWPHLVRPGIEA